MENINERPAQTIVQTLELNVAAKPGFKSSWPELERATISLVTGIHSSRELTSESRDRKRELVGKG